MDYSYDMSRLDALVGRILSIQDITVGNPEKDFIVRYRGRLRGDDTEAAYDQLTGWLEPFNITPLFRWDEKRHAVILVPGKPKPAPSNPIVNIVMFALTVVGVIFAGWANSANTPLPANPLQAVGAVLREGWPFAVSLMAILLTHEFGHYLMSRHHGVQATLPYFIPFLPPFGTMGAVIMMKSVPKNRRQLLDIGLAGPLAGLVVAIPVLLIGLSLSTVDPIPAIIPSGMAFSLEGNSLLYLLAKFAMFGKLLPAPASYGDLSPFLYWLRFFFTGKPYPLGGVDVMLNPVAYAGWAGLLVTALNLIPAGQLDGGHAVYVLIGRRGAARLLPFLLIGGIVLALFWPGWWLWVALIFFLGRAFDDPLDQITPLDNRRRALAILGIIIFFLVFIPVPMTVVTGG